LFGRLERIVEGRRCEDKDNKKFERHNLWSHGRVELSSQWGWECVVMMISDDGMFIKGTKGDFTLSR
jgi:hypothetical protein